MEHKVELDPTYVEELLKWTGTGFDLRTKIIDPKSGATVKDQPYRRVVDKEKGTYYIRDNKMYLENGALMHPERKAAAHDKKLSE